MAFLAAGHPQSLKARVLRAGSWTLFGYGAALVMRLFGNLVMAPLLAPDAFGIMAIATTINVLVGLFSDLGIRQSIIQSSRGQNAVFLNTAWTVQVLRGVWIWIACMAVAAGLYFARMMGVLPPDSVYSDPLLPAIVAVGSFSSVILGLHSMKLHLLSRSLDLSRITLIELIQMVVSYAVAIGIGWLTHSVWSFIINGLVGSVVYTVLTHVWLTGHRDRFCWNRDALAEILRFGRWVFISSIIGVLAMNGDRLMLGAWITATALGFYSIASGLSSMVDGIAGRFFSNVSLPALGEIARERPQLFSSRYLQMRWGADAIYVAAAGFLFATGERIVSILYDQRYLPAGEMLQILSFSLLFSRFALAQNAYVALGKPNYIAALNAVRVISLFTLVPAMYFLFDVKGALIGLATYLAPTLPLIFWFNRKHGLNNLVVEVGSLAIWPCGWLAGQLVLVLLSIVR